MSEFYSLKSFIYVILSVFYTENSEFSIISGFSNNLPRDNYPHHIQILRSRLHPYQNR